MPEEGKLHRRATESNLVIIFENFLFYGRKLGSLTTRTARGGGAFLLALQILEYPGGWSLFIVVK